MNKDDWAVDFLVWSDKHLAEQNILEFYDKLSKKTKFVSLENRVSTKLGAASELTRMLFADVKKEVPENIYPKLIDKFIIILEELKLLHVQGDENNDN